MNRKLIWGIPTAMVAIGLLIVLAAYLQPSVQATVTEVRDLSYTPARRSARVRSSAKYGATLEVVYPDGQGGEATAEVEFSTIHRNEIPREGDSILISRGLGGMVPHPSRRLVGIGGAGAVIGGFFLFTFTLVRISLKRRERRKLDDSPDELK